VTTSPETAASLSAFFEAFDRLKVGVGAPSSVRRLEALFEAIRAHRAITESPEPQARPPFDAARLSSFLPALRSGIALAKRDGRLLNVWTVARLGRDEVRTAAVLTWVLDCFGSHGFGSAILEALIARLEAREPSDAFADLEIGQRYRITREHSPLGDHGNRIDIAIEGTNCVIFLEVKIDAPEGPEQLQRYRWAAHGKARAAKKAHSRLLYLSQSLPSDIPKDVILLTWTDVRKSIEAAVARSGATDLSAAVLLQFAQHLKPYR
jgi:hypothetical protein